RAVATPCTSLDCAARPSSSYFFLRLGTPRDLHSFPTRRSSDLSTSKATSGWRAATSVNRGARADTAIPGIRAEKNTAAGTRKREDRKSTRLNSSHVKISYAVFCLKKKTNTSG